MHLNGVGLFLGDLPGPFNIPTTQIESDFTPLFEKGHWLRGQAGHQGIRTKNSAVVSYQGMLRYSCFLRPPCCRASIWKSEMQSKSISFTLIRHFGRQQTPNSYNWRPLGHCLRHLGKSWFTEAHRNRNSL